MAAMDASRDGKRSSIGDTVRQHLLKKTRLCKFYQEGMCRYGDQCAYAHGEDELESMPDLSKTSLCTAWLSNECLLTKTECRFAHGKSDLRRVCSRSKDGNPDKSNIEAARPARSARAAETAKVRKRPDVVEPMRVQTSISLDGETEDTSFTSFGDDCVVFPPWHYPEVGERITDSDDSKSDPLHSELFWHSRGFCRPYALFPIEPPSVLPMPNFNKKSSLFQDRNVSEHLSRRMWHLERRCFS